MAAVKFFEHPDLMLWSGKWQMYRDLFEGDHATLVSTTYLWPHELEGSVQEAGRAPDGSTWTVGQKLRHIRAMRSRYLNLFEPIVSNWISLAFSKGINIPDEVAEMLGEEEMADIDGKGNSLENFIKTVLAPAYFRDGRPWLMADAPSKEFATLEQQRVSGFRPYLELLDVLDVKDWQVDDSGRIEWVRHEYMAIAPRADATEAPQQLPYSRVMSVVDGKYTQRIYKKEGEGWKLSDTIPVDGWDVVPVAAVLHNEPWVKDVAELQLALFNIMSAWFNGLNATAFQRVLIAAGGPTEQHKVSISEYAWSFIPENADVTVIEAGSQQANTDAMAWCVNQMYRVAFNRTRGLSDASDEAPAADTIREMNAELISLLKVALTEIEGVLNRSLEFYARFKGKKDFKSTISFDKDLTSEDVDDQITRFSAYRDEIRKVLAWRKAHLRKVVRQEKFGDEETQEILDGIEALKDEPVIDPLRAFGAFGAGAGAGAVEDDGEESQETDPAPDDQEG